MGLLRTFNSSGRIMGHAEASAEEPTIDLGGLVAALGEFGLMDKAEVRGFIDGLPSDQRPDSAKRLARELVRAGKLTRFQAAALCRGQGRHLNVDGYLILELIGVGGAGRVYRVLHRRLRRIAALKILEPEVARSPTAMRRFQREAEAAASLTHPNIVVVYDAGEHKRRPFLVMEYIDGTDLARLVKKQGPLPVARAVDAISQAAKGLQAAHQRGIIHRDVKPHNLLLDQAGTVKVSDLGLARVIQESRAVGAGADELELTRADSTIGTAYYIPPEQALDARQADHRADIYGLGCTLYSILAGRPPYRGDSYLKVIMGHREGAIPSLRADRPDVPEALDDLLRRMLAKAPADRPQTMDEVIDALSAISLDDVPEYPVFSESQGADASPILAEPSTPTIASGATFAGLVLDDGASSSTITGSEPLAESDDREDPWWRRPPAQITALTSALMSVVLTYVFWPATEDTRPRVVEAPRNASPIDPVNPWSDPDPEPATVEVPPSRLSDQEAPPKIRSDFETPSTESEPLPSRRLLATEGPPRLVHPFEGHTADLRRVAVSPDGRLALSVANDGTARLWDLDQGRQVAVINHATGLNGVAFFPETNRAVTAGGPDLAYLIDLEEVEKPPRTFAGHEGYLHDVAVSPDSTQLLTASEDKTVRVWDIASGEEIRRLEDHKAPVWCVAFAPDGDRFLSSSQDGTIQIYRALSGAPAREPLRHTGSARSVVFSPDGSMILSGGFDGTVRLWNLTTGRMRWRDQLDPEGKPVYGVALSADGRLAWAGGQGGLALWDVATGTRLQQFETDHEVMDVALIPGHDLALSAGSDRTLRLWKLPGSDHETESTAEPLTEDDEIGRGQARTVRGPRPVSILHGADPKALQDWLTWARSNGFMPTHLEAQDAGGVPLFQAVAEPNPRGLPWTCEVLEGSDAFERLQADNANRGVEMLVYTACYQGETKRIVPLFSPAAETRRAWRTRILPENIPSFLEARRAGGHRPAGVSSYNEGPDGYALAVPTVAEDGHHWSLRYDLDAEQFRAVLAEARTVGMRPVDVTSCTLSGQVRYAVLLLGDGTRIDWDIDAEVPEFEWPTLRDRRLAAGYRPLALSAYWSEGQSWHLALWARPRN